MPAQPRFRLIVALVFGLSLTTLAVGGCSLLRTTTPPAPLVDYRPMLRKSFVLAADQMAALPNYSITVEVNPAGRAYTGTLDVTIPITGDYAIGDLYFRLYPNLAQFGGEAEVNSMRVNGLTPSYGYEANNTAIHIPLPVPIDPGTSARVEMGFSGKLPARKAGSYSIFGLNGDELSLSNFYPILAGHRGEEWALDVANPQGDVGFHDAAFYRVTVIAPADEVIAATGAMITRTEDSNGLATTGFVLGPAREFTAIMSPRFQTQEAYAYGTIVRSYYFPEDAVAGRSALYDAVAALQIYSDQYGPYPYEEMSVVEAPLTFHGMEFPGLSLIGRDAYGRYAADLEKLVVHEVAHQWWYNQVGSDQTGNPWLDEGLAEYSMYYYFQDRHGVPAARTLRRTRWEAPVAAAVKSGIDAPIGQPITAYPKNYETMIYGKGALFFATLRDTVGDETFQQILRTYLVRNRWQIATPEGFRAVAEEVSGQDLSELFDKWVGPGPS